MGLTYVNRNILNRRDSIPRIASPVEVGVVFQGPQLNSEYRNSPLNLHNLHIVGEHWPSLRQHHDFWFEKSDLIDFLRYSKPIAESFRLTALLNLFASAAYWVVIIIIFRHDQDRLRGLD
ncbi:hypothetical protein B0O99DRAFT_598717 [Bisporella sp. PMI_857]|nr:hypothetical protein B0O99DRAFT_598717 [Bisporella sp. PMI_857]